MGEPRGIIKRREFLLGSAAVFIAPALPTSPTYTAGDVLEGLTVDFRAASGPRYSLSFFVRRGLEGIWERVTVPAKPNFDGSISLPKALGYIGEGDAMILEGSILETGWIKFDGEEPSDA